MKRKAWISLFLALVMILAVACGGKTEKTEEPTKELTTEQPAEAKQPKDGAEVELTVDDEGDVKLAPPEEQIFRFSSSSVVIGLNPLLNTTAPDNGAHELILETLVREVATTEGNTVLEPGIAESWDVSEDGLVYTFHIRENARWNDGVPCTAHDFEYTYKKMADPQTASTNAYLLSGIVKNFEQSLYNNGENEENNMSPDDIGVKALDDHTLEIELVKPYSYFTELLCGIKPVREDMYEQYGQEYGSAIDKVVYNGPFIVESWEQNTMMVFAKNENYWNADNVALQRVERRIIGETQTAVQALLGNEIDVAYTNEPNWQAMIEDDGRFQQINVIENNPEFYSFNASNKYFKNPKIRLAFMLGYDRESLVNEVLDGIGEPLYTMIPDIMNVGETPYHELVNNENYFVKKLQKQYPDPQALLIEGLEEEGLDPDPTKVDVILSSRGTSEFSKLLAEWMVQQWQKNLGVTVKIDMLEWNIMWDRVDQLDYDIVTSGWGPYYNDPNGLLSIFHPTDGYFNSSKSGWVDDTAKEFGELLDKAEDVVDPKEKAQLYLQAEELLVGSGIISPSYVGTSNYYLNPKIGGYYTSAFASPDYTKIYIKAQD